MDLLNLLRERVDSLPSGDHTVGLTAVLQHIRVAIGHFERGHESGNDAAFTDAIYRTNQAFEGSLKEAFRVLAAKDPDRERPANIEAFLEKHEVLRPRVIEQVRRYRTEWRNPSTHDYRLDFDEDESLLAIVSISALAIVLVDQVAEKLSFDAAKAAAPSVPVASATDALIDRVAECLTRFSLPPSNAAGVRREVELVGAVAGHLAALLSDATVTPDSAIAEGRRERADVIVALGADRVIVEVKHAGRSRNALFQGLAQLEHYADRSGINRLILFLFDERQPSVTRQRIDRQPGDVVIRIVAPPETA